jgi:hypothetical protein
MWRMPVSISWRNNARKDSSGFTKKERYYFSFVIAGGDKKFVNLKFSIFNPFLHQQH